MEKNSDEWNNWCTSEGRNLALPGDWARLSEFKQLLLLRALRPDRITNALQVGLAGRLVCFRVGVSIWGVPAYCLGLCCDDDS